MRAALNYHILMGAIYSSFILSGCLATRTIPKQFVVLQNKIEHLTIDLRYYSINNFIGDTVDGYQSNLCYITRKAARALKKVEKELNQKGLGLKIFDAYRPQKAVNHFVRWAEDLSDTVKKTQFYPTIAKSRLFEEGYISARSGHSRGSTIDLTIIYLQGDRIGTELDMGTPWDFFSPLSWPSNQSFKTNQRQNRMLLQQIMIKHGFIPLKEEWWHFTLENEPYPDTYFDFDIKSYPR